MTIHVRPLGKGRNGFTLVEILLVLAIIGIISAIAIPSLIGQRRRAKVIGDAAANAKVIAMQLEAWKSETGTYGANATASWAFSSSQPHYGAPSLAGWTATSNPFSSFRPSGSSGINFSVVVDASGLRYIIDATDPSYNPSDAPAANVIFRTDQTGAELYRYK